MISPLKRMLAPGRLCVTAAACATGSTLSDTPQPDANTAAISVAAQPDTAHALAASLRVITSAVASTADRPRAAKQQSPPLAVRVRGARARGVRRREREAGGWRPERGCARRLP